MKKHKLRAKARAKAARTGKGKVYKYHAHNVFKQVQQLAIKKQKLNKLKRLTHSEDTVCSQCKKGTMKPTQWNRLVCSTCTHSLLL